MSFCLFFSHGECPSKDATVMFIRLCEHFIEKNPTELIGKEPLEFYLYIPVYENVYWARSIVLMNFSHKRVSKLSDKHNIFLTFIFVVEI